MLTFDVLCPAWASVQIVRPNQSPPQVRTIPAAMQTWRSPPPLSNPRAASGSLLPDSFPNRISRWLHHIHPIHRHHTAPTHLRNCPSNPGRPGLLSRPPFTTHHKLRASPRTWPTWATRPSGHMPRSMSDTHQNPLTPAHIDELPDRGAGSTGDVRKHAHCRPGHFSRARSTPPRGTTDRLDPSRAAATTPPRARRTNV